MAGSPVKSYHRFQVGQNRKPRSWTVRWANSSAWLATASSDSGIAFVVMAIMACCLPHAADRMDGPADQRSRRHRGGVPCRARAGLVPPVGARAQMELDGLQLGELLDPEAPQLATQAALLVA